MGDKIEEIHYHYHYHIEGSDEPMLVQLTDENTKAINQSERILLVPGDLVTVASGIETAQLNCDTYASMNAIMHVKNTSDTNVSFTARGTQGPVGDIPEIEVINYNRPLVPNQVIVWSYTKAIFAQYFKAYFTITEASPGGEVDVNHAVVLSKGNVT